MYINYIKEERFGSEAADLDKRHILETKPSELRLVELKMKEKFIAVGANQNIKQLDIDKLKQDGLTWVRKLTNGTASWFDGTEIVYSIILGEQISKAKPASVFQKDFMYVFQSVFSSFNVETNIVNRGSRHTYAPFCCFNALTKNELEYNNRKLVGVSFIKVDNKVFGQLILHTNNNYLNLYKYIKEDWDGKIKPVSLADLNITRDAFMYKLREALTNE